jgi:hypothetical protein
MLAQLGLGAPLNPPGTTRSKTAHRSGPTFSGLFGTSRFGSVSAAVTVLTAPVKGAPRLTPEVRRSIQADEDRSNREVQRYIRLKAQLEKTSDPALVRRIESGLIQARERGEVYKLKALISSGGRVPQGPRLEGTAIELRRNALAEQWENASAVEKRRIEALISGYDEELSSLAAQVSRSGSKKGSRSEEPEGEGSAEQEALVPEQPAPDGAPPPAPLAPVEPPTASIRDPELILPMQDEGVRALLRQVDDVEMRYIDPASRSSQSGYGPRGQTTAEQDALLAEQTFKAAVLNPEPPTSVNQALVTGLGGLQFASKGPPGPGRNVRISMYPARPSDCYAGADGIVVPGDDPVLLMRLTATVPTNFVASVDYAIQTRIFSYGSYRVMGFQCNPQGNYLVTDALGNFRNTAQVVGVGISVKSLQVYNGEQILLPVGELDVNGFTILDVTDSYPGISSLNLPAFMQSGPYNPRSADRYYMGLRTNPVLESTARVDAIVRCFAYVRSSDPGINPTGMLASDRIEVPISFNLIGQMLEDKIFGNPKIPEPAARPGAQVQVGLKDLGFDTEGVRRLQLQNTRYIATTPKSTSE